MQRANLSKCIIHLQFILSCFITTLIVCTVQVFDDIIHCSSFNCIHTVQRTGGDNAITQLIADCCYS